MRFTKIQRTWGTALATVALGIGLVACGTARRGEPVAGPLKSSSAEVANGQRVFMQHCYMCHPGGEGGLGPALNNKPLPAFAIRAQVGRGFGTMPKFTPEQISREQLSDLIAYLKALRHNKT